MKISLIENANQPGNIKFNWGYRGLQGFLCSSKSHKLDFYFNDEKRKLFYLDLIDMSAPAHAFAIKDDISVRLIYTSSV